MTFRIKRPHLKKLVVSIILLSAFIQCMAQNPLNFKVRSRLGADIIRQSYIYAEKDTIQLGLDIYNTHTTTTTKRPCVLFVFGGAFVGGKRDDSLYYNYFDTLARSGYTVVSISYRLGLKGAKKISLFNTQPLQEAVDMAVDDLYDATNWIITHSDDLGIDTSKIILSGSSSGAITVLTAEYKRCNRIGSSEKLPEGFRYAGVISFSGAVLNLKGSYVYKSQPAPSLFFHGTADKIVPYRQIRFLNKGLYGSDKIAKRFKKHHYSYYIYRETGLGHEVSVLPMFESLPVILGFLEQYVEQGKKYEKDMSYSDPGRKPILTISAKQLFKKLQQPTNTN